MAAHTWELDRDIGLVQAELREAKRTGNVMHVACCEGQLTKLEALLADERARCAHVENPERLGRCYKCGLDPMPAQQSAPGPGIRKATRPLDLIRKTG